jgi:hypothetical protein
MAVGLLSTGLAARAIGSPLRDLLNVLRRVGTGSLDTEVVVDDPGEIGMLQGGVKDIDSGQNGGRSGSGSLGSLAPVVLSRSLVRSMG